MKIRTRLRLNTFISLGVVILIMLSLSWSFREIFSAERNMELVDEMRQFAFDRILLRDDYLLHHEKRAAAQWHTKSEALRSLLEHADNHFEREEDRALLQEARKDFNATYSIFAKVIEDHQKRELVARQELAFSRAESRLISQVFLKAYSLTDNINRLHEAVRTVETRALNQGIIIIAIFIISGIMAIIINSGFTNKTLSKRIAALGKGIAIIGAGDLDYRIAAEGDDELSALAQANNEMASKLKKSYTSMENLQEEVVERKKAEEALTHQTVELKRSNEELQQFAYIASHDLQEPLRMIASYLQLIEKRYKGQLDKDADEFIAFAVEGASRLQDMISGLLAYSRVQTKGKPLEEVNCSEVFGKAISNLKVAIEESGALITADRLPVVIGDPVQLVQVFQNLLSNSIKFRAEGLPRVHVSAEKKGEESVFSVKDNGIGIAPEYRDRIFNIFQRLHGREYPGVGIGLSLCRRIVERHGGRIWFESEVGKGTTFYFTIPIKEEKRDEQSEPHEADRYPAR